MRRFGFTATVCLGVIILLSSCAPNFHKFRTVESNSDGFLLYRNSATGNARIDIKVNLPDTLLFKRKLNGGIGAQVVGNSRLAIVPTFNKRIYFLNPNTGKEITSLVTKSAVGSAVPLVDQFIYYAEEAGGDRLVCFDLLKGKRVWKHDFFDPQGAPVICDDEIYITSRVGKLYQLDRLQGEITWEYDTGGQLYSAPAVDAKRVFVGNDQGELVCLDRADGTLVWSFSTASAIVASPMVDEYLYCGSSDGTMYALEKSSGEVVWTFHTAGQIFATPVATKEKLLFGSHDRFVYCVSTAEGRLLFSHEIDGIIQSSPILVGDFLICASAAGTIYIFDLKGVIVRTFKVKGSVSAPLAYFDDKLYVVTKKRMLYCFGSSQID